MSAVLNDKLSVRGHGSMDEDEPVGQVGGHDEVVLHHKGSLLRVHNEALDNLCSDRVKRTDG